MLANVVFQAVPLQILRNVRIIYYLRIYIGGFAFLFLYNVATGIFTSLGDSKTPLYFLIGSSLGNIFLDYWFVAGLHWGVAGVGNLYCPGHCLCAGTYYHGETPEAD